MSKPTETFTVTLNREKARIFTGGSVTTDKGAFDYDTASAYIESRIRAALSSPPVADGPGLTRDDVERLEEIAGVLPTDEFPEAAHFLRDLSKRLLSEPVQGDVERPERFTGPDGEEYSALNQREGALLEGAVNWERRATKITEKARALLDALDTAESLAAGGADQRANVNRVLTAAARDLRDALAAPDVERLGGEEGPKGLRFSERALWNETDDQRVHEVLARLARMRGGNAQAEQANERLRAALETIRVQAVHGRSPRDIAADALHDNPPPPLEHSKGGLEEEAKRELAERDVVISFGGGPLDGRTGFARDLRPIQFDTGTYRWVVAHPEGDVEFAWGPTHFLDQASPQPNQGSDQPKPIAVPPADFILRAKADQPKDCGGSGLDKNGVNEFGVAMCGCGNKRVHAWEPGESCSPERVIPASAPDCPNRDQAEGGH